MRGPTRGIRWATSPITGPVQQGNTTRPAPALLVNPAPQPGHARIQWVLDGEPATMQSSEDLRNWTPVREVTTDGFYDEPIDGARKFWRLAYQGASDYKTEPLHS